MTRLPLVLAALTLAACGPREGAADSGRATSAADAARRDSVIAGSRLPGAAGVGSAMRARDSLDRRTRLADSVAQAP